MYFYLQIDAPLPATFPSINSYVKYTNADNSIAVRVEFGFRTHDPDGILLYHALEIGGFIQVMIRLLIASVG